MHSSGSSGPTLQQQQLQTEQATQNANLNIEENSQRKSILNSMQGSRVFRESALSRSLAGNTPGGAAAPAPGPSAAQSAALRGDFGGVIAPVNQSLMDTARSSGATPAGGAGASGLNPIGVRGGGSGRGPIP